MLQQPSQSEPAEKPATTEPAGSARKSPESKTVASHRAGLLRDFAAVAMTRVVGYGLLVLFSFDMVEILLAYRPMNPQADALLVSQVLERIAVPLLGYALVFLVEPSNAGRLELMVRKLLSFGSLAWVLVCLGLSLLAATTGLRLVRASGSGFQRQLVERTALLNGVQKNLPKLTDRQVAIIYNELVGKQQGAASVPANSGEMRNAVKQAIPGFIDSETSLINNARLQSRMQIAVTTVKYGLGGLVSAILFLFIWEATYPARAARVFRHRHGPNMKVEDSVVSWFGRMVAGAAEFSPLPNLEAYRWYRHLKRAWRRWRDSRRY